MPFSLLSADGQQKYDVRDGAPMLVGRAPTCDVPVFDPTISRRHAELSLVAGGVEILDLGSSNGTFVNGDRVTKATARGGDVVTFGKVVFKLQDTAPPRPAMPHGPPAGATIVRSVKGSTSFALPTADIAGLKSPTGEQAQQVVDLIEKNRAKLKTLLDISQQLGKLTDLDKLLEKIVETAQETLAVDRVAIMLLDEKKELVPKIGRDKRGGEQSRAVPQSIARQAVQNKEAILSDNAGEDTRFAQGASILMQQVRSAICVPLIGSADQVLGVLYLDNVTTTHRFSEEDLDYCIAFASIAGTAIEREQFAQQIQRELVVRNNFQRYFAPAVAERIATEGTATLGGAKRRVAVLFSDIRGFTALSETMNPDDMAHLLTEYFTEMVECVFNGGGTLDKFIGDAVMAQWGAPMGADNDPDQAMAAGIEMIKELDKLNLQWKKAGKPELQIGIGLNVGEAFAGNIGSERRMEYTVIGDTVNTASRLCSAAGPREILISDDFRRALKSPPGLVEMPPMELKGKSQPVPVYRVKL